MLCQSSHYLMVQWNPWSISTSTTPNAATPQPRSGSTMECSQSDAWTMNRSLLVASRVKTFPGTPTNTDSTLPRAAHLDDGVITT